MENLVNLETNFGENIAASKRISLVWKIDVEEVRCTMNDMKNGKASSRTVWVCLRNVEDW